MSHAWAMVRRAFVAATLAPLAAGAADYTIDPNHTYPSLEFTHMGLSTWRGKFNRTTGKAMLDPAARLGRVEIRVDTTSIDFGHDKMNEFAVSEDWLNVAKYPNMSYSGTLRYEGDKAVALDGQLTLLGVTRPLRLKVNAFTCILHPYFKKEVCGADAEGDLNRADYGMTQYSEGELGKIHLRIQVEAIRDD